MEDVCCVQLGHAGGEGDVLQGGGGSGRHRQVAPPRGWGPSGPHGAGCC